MWGHWLHKKHRHVNIYFYDCDFSLEEQNACVETKKIIQESIVNVGRLFFVCTLQSTIRNSRYVDAT